MDVTDAKFQSEVLDSKIPVLVDFWAPWCAPCRIVTPIVEELDKDYGGKIKVLKMNVDDNPDAPGQYGVMSIPSLIVFKDGKPVKTMIGAQGKESFKRGIEEALAS